ncbi:tyrosinase [Streptomyces nitrosporeus]|uniref:Tyrosinase n=1 Tax=Streptomyces nitrosporeus TaxID=28894 RepID=A0A5J6FM59_9ACTN|nr:tyrosinase family oxidase copper chaperone [Streptomyces nitrosporeus]QEU76055.1 tyrosinase [Streptomyces nitrosporeus]GGZ07498.1 hypothetical protein GCM10010327_42410 [Streptomyces nitrosporeus]
MDPTTPTTTAGPAGTPPSARRPGRRAALRTVFTAAAVAGTAGALAPVLFKGTGTPPGGDRRQQAPERFSERYRGREIKGTLTAVVPAGGPARPDTAAAALAMDAADVTIDGRPLHLMRRADGSYLSAVNHYESFPTPLEAARAAVDELGEARLSATSPHTI